MLPALLLLAVQAPDLAALAEKTRPAVVKLVAEDAAGNEVGNGTGFFVAADGRLVTNHHVIAATPGLTALLDGKRRARILGVLADDEADDLAVLQVEPGSYPFLTLEGGREPRVGEPVAVIGSPIGWEGTLSNGIVAAIRTDGADFGSDGKEASWQLQITAPISPGSSGSPVMAEDGKVLGIAVGVDLRGQALNFAIPAKKAVKLLATIDADARPRPLSSAAAPPSRLRRNLAISAGVFLLLGAAAFVALRRSSPPHPVRRDA
jgi:S1-C subfamily serine protease